MRHASMIIALFGILGGCGSPSETPELSSSNPPTETGPAKTNPVNVEPTEWHATGDAEIIKPSYTLSRFGVEAFIEAPLINGFGVARFDLRTVEDWLVPGLEACINVISYEVADVSVEGPVETSQDADGIFEVRPEGVGEGSVVVHLKKASVEPWMRDWEPNEGCESPWYPDDFRFTFEFEAVDVVRSAFVFDECEEPFRVSEHTDFTTTMRVFDARDRDVTHAPNWPGIAGFTATKSGESVPVNVTPPFVWFSGLSPGVLTLTSDFGSVTEVQITSAREEVHDFLVEPMWGTKIESLVVEPVPIGAEVRTAITAEFGTPHCTSLAAPSIVIDDPTQCVAVDTDSVRLEAAGECQFEVEIGDVVRRVTVEARQTS